MESCDIYIKSIRYEDAAWVENPDILLELIFNNLNEIPRFYFVSMSLNMSQVYNVNLKNTNYDDMILYLKGVKYKNEEFLSLEYVTELISHIQQQLGYIEHLEFGAIEIRSSNLYSDRDLGIN